MKIKLYKTIDPSHINSSNLNQYYSITNCILVSGNIQSGSLATIKLIVNDN